MTWFEFPSPRSSENLPPYGADCQAHRKSHKITVAVRRDHRIASGVSPRRAVAIIMALPS
jgi:hypothetical protein